MDRRRDSRVWGAARASTLKRTEEASRVTLGVMNPFMIEDEDDDEETTQNSMSDEVEVELYGQNKVRSSA